jgi:hypothetical protein
MLMDTVTSENRNVIKKEAESILNVTNLRYLMWNVKSEETAVNNKGDSNHFEIICKIPEQLSWKTRHQSTAENSHVGHWTHTSGSTNVNVETFIMENDNTCIINRNHRIAAILYTAKTWFSSGI